MSDPTIIADAGVGWVRINFIIGPWQDPQDQNRPSGKNWQETYQSIINGFVGKGLKLYGLISDQALRDKPGGHLRRRAAQAICVATRGSKLRQYLCHDCAHVR